MTRPTLTLVIPIFNEEDVIPELARRLREVIQSWQALIDSWEVVFVNDGSRDQSLAHLKKLALEEPRFKVLSFARSRRAWIALRVKR
jgi:glycosyltransferase involved in cell wall biosynthesis